MRPSLALREARYQARIAYMGLPDTPASRGTITKLETGDDAFTQSQIEGWNAAIKCIVKLSHGGALDEIT